MNSVETNSKQKIEVIKVAPTKKLAVKARIVSDRKVPFTHDKAYEHLSLERFVGEREINERHVQYLYSEAQSGRFLWDHVILTTAKLGKKKYQINGQHTCWMRLNLPQTDSPTVRYLEYEVSDEDQLRGLYGVIDAGKGRTPAHVLKALLVGTEEFSTVWPSIISTIGAGFKIWMYPNYEEQRRQGSQEIAHLLKTSHNTTMRMVADYLQKYWTTQQHVHKAAVVAALFATMDARPTLALNFWTAVADGLGITDKTDARYKLRELLMKVVVERFQAQGGIRNKRLMTTEEVYRSCIVAWNKWRDNSRVETSIRPTNKRLQPK